MTQPRLDAGAPRILAGRYRLHGKLADSALATVWRANDQVLGRDVAIKLLHAQLAADPEVAGQFRHEAVGAASLNHPGIVRVFDTGEHEGIPRCPASVVTSPPEDKDRADEEGKVRERVQRLRPEAPVGALAVEVDPRPGIHGAIVTAGLSQRGLRPPSR